MKPTDKAHAAQHNRVPIRASIGLFVFALLLSTMGFLLPGADTSMHLMVNVVGLHVLGFPGAFVLAGWVMTRVGHRPVYWRNAVSLGWLLSCVWMLTKISQGF